MELQHEIKTLLAERQHQRNEKAGHYTPRAHQSTERVSKVLAQQQDEVYMMLALQAATIEEVCSL